MQVEAVPPRWFRTLVLGGLGLGPLALVMATIAAFLPTVDPVVAVTSCTGLHLYASFVLGRIESGR